MTENNRTLGDYLFRSPTLLVWMNGFWAAMSFAIHFNIISHLIYPSSDYWKAGPMAVTISGWMYFAYQFVFAQACCVFKNDEDAKKKIKSIVLIFVAVRLLFILLSIYVLPWFTPAVTFYTLLGEIVRDVQLFVVYCAPYSHYHDIHFDSYFVMLIILFTDALLNIFVENKSDPSLAYNYFTVKMGILLFEIGTDSHWHQVNLPSEMGRFTLFILFIAAKLVMQMASFVYDKGDDADPYFVHRSQSPLIYCCLLVELAVSLWLLRHALFSPGQVVDEYICV